MTLAYVEAKKNINIAVEVNHLEMKVTNLFVA
jgi:hypothetical protein